MPRITRIERALPVVERKKKVAAYARVSMDSEWMHHSLSAQVSYYSSLIQKNPGWQYAGVFADYGTSGTRTAGRDEFRRMIAAAEKGEIDIILTKSIQRFARNTVDLLDTVRHLKDIGVEVRFEKEHINSLSGDGELMLTILASFAQEESRSISENCKWRIRKRFQAGIPSFHFSVYGYRWEGDEMVIVPEEAEVVRRIYRDYLAGKGLVEISRELVAEGCTTRRNCLWSGPGIKLILTNVTYTGNLLLQKEFVSDHISKVRKQNRGELPQYYVEGTHPAIIDRETFDAVQSERARRKALGQRANKGLNTSCFTGRLKCPHCGVSYMHYKEKSNPLQDYWVCGSKSVKGLRCPVGGYINQNSMKKICNEVLGLDEFDEAVFLDRVAFINIPKRHVLEFHLESGEVVTKDCPNTGNKDRWTPEARAAASEKQKRVMALRRKEREEACRKEK